MNYNETNEAVERLRRKVSNLRKREKELIFFSQIKNYTIASLVVIMAAVVITSAIRINRLTNEVNDLTAELVSIEQESIALCAGFTEVCDQYDLLAETLQQVSKTAVSLSESNSYAIETLNSYEVRLSEYELREELHDNYEWALVREDGTRTDINYDDILTIQDLVEQKGLSNDTVDLVLAIAMTESNGTAAAKSSTSSATGLGQFLSSTGNFVFTKLMGQSNYNHDTVATDSTTNLSMMVEYLEHLNISANGDIDEVINAYRGIDSDKYKESIDKYLIKNGLSLASISLSQ